MVHGTNAADVPEDPARLAIIDRDAAADPGLILGFLKQDRVVLVEGVHANHIDSLMYAVADQLGLGDALELQAGFADYLGHRQRVGKFFMTVNKRRDYQFISSHSEGGIASGMQLASFYCFENTTDGGETILMNVDAESAVWQFLRERVRRGRLEKPSLPEHEMLRARRLYHLNLPADILRNDDQIVQERRTEIAGLTIVEVLAKPDKFYCRLLDRKLNVYWDSIDGPDLDSAREFERLLREWGLLKEPPGGFDLSQLDEGASRRVWRSGMTYGQLFKCRVTRKLAPGDLVIQNNLTWTHANNNWSPGSGTRKVVASFA